MLIIFLCLLLFLASVVRQHKFIELGLWSDTTYVYKERISLTCIFYTYIISKLYWQWRNLFDKKKKNISTDVRVVFGKS